MDIRTLVAGTNGQGKGIQLKFYNISHYSALIMALNVIRNYVIVHIAFIDFYFSCRSRGHVITSPDDPSAFSTMQVKFLGLLLSGTTGLLIVSTFS